MNRVASESIDPGASHDPCCAVRNFPPFIRGAGRATALTMADSATSEPPCHDHGQAVRARPFSSTWHHQALGEVSPSCARLRSTAESESKFEVRSSSAIRRSVALRSDRSEEHRSSRLRSPSLSNFRLEATHELRCAPQAQR
jgi:hypothetical protein